jgi:hypothetical protein
MKLQKRDEEGFIVDFHGFSRMVLESRCKVELDA